MTPNATSRLLTIAGTAIMTVAVLSVAAPATAADEDSKSSEPRACWVQAETGAMRCYADEETMDAAVVRFYGGAPIEENSREGQLVARDASVAAVGSYTIARLYVDINYGGSYLPVYASTATYCADGGVSSLANLGSYNDTTSSVRAYWGCQITLYQNTSWTVPLGTWTANANLGANSDKASSYRVKD